MLAKFWWNASQSSNHSINWMAWDRMTQHKHMGDLKAQYYKDTSFLEAKLGGIPIFIWRNLLEARDVILSGERWRVGTGESINIVGTRTWDWEIITDIFNDKDCESIQNTLIEEDLQNDVLTWDHDITGHYIVKSAYKILQVQKGAWDYGDNTGRCWEIIQPNTTCDLNWDFSRWFERRLLTESADKKVQMATIFWEIWRHRNDVIWSKKFSTPERLVAVTMDYLSMEDGPSQINEVMQPSLAAVVAIKEALSWLKEMEWKRIIVESDCLVAIQSILSALCMRSRFGRIIEDCRRLI
ncbi:uncharacterized protein LOC141714448 [Apium graveolens]|uniref:uncharacterized protein LOC141714448 n=1 Tax=Apium graveolens TaxID=4045 RepID=UPI003D7BDBEF